MITGRRYAAPAGGALLVTAGLLALMQVLVQRGGPAAGLERPRGVLDFVRLRRETPPEAKRRRRPKPVPPVAPPAPPRVATPAVSAPHVAVARVAPPAFDPALSIVGSPGPGIAAGSADAGAVPLVRVAPQYPPRAQARGIEGSVRVRFTVTAEGRTEAIEIIEAYPKGYFESAARRAVARYRYKPRIEGGVPVDSPGEEIVIDFELDE